MFNPAIPQSTDPRAQSQSQILTNFSAINAGFSINHMSLNSDANSPSPFEGMHKVLTMIKQAGDPVTAANEVAFYNKLVNSVPQIFFRPQSTGTPIQMTAPNTGGIPQSVVSFVAGPFMIYAGFISNPTNGQVVTLTPASTLIYVGTNALSPRGNNVLTVMIPTNLSGNTFTIRFQTGVTAAFMYFFAIGKP
jgi:hypothetical protein